MFSPKTQKLMRHPQNIGELKNPDGIGTAGNPKETNYIKMWIKLVASSELRVSGSDSPEPSINPRNQVIEDIKFKIYGCLPNAATGSIATTLANNKTLEEALKINETHILAELGGLPPDKKHCAGLAVACLRNAIQDALNKRNEF